MNLASLPSPLKTFNLRKNQFSGAAAMPKGEQFALNGIFCMEMSKYSKNWASMYRAFAADVAVNGHIQLYQAQI